jgi:2,3-dihydroxybenzoate decarboxylase
MADVEAKLLDTDERIELMDTYGIETTILSLTSPGIQSILNIEQAAETARESNDTVRAQYVDAHPTRLRSSPPWPCRTPMAPPPNSNAPSPNWAPRAP